jgi:L-rhamnonate dehydratase
MKAPRPSATRLVEITFDKVYVPFKEAIQWSAGSRPGTTRLVVRAVTADGTVGWGETICLLEFIEPVLAKTVIPLAIGEDALNIERLLRKMEGAGYYHHKRALVMALCAVEMACWDIVGKKAGLPLCDVWGGRYRERVPLVAYLQSGSADKIAAEAAAMVKLGYGTVKVKLGSNERADLALMQAVREAVGPDIKIRGDVNGAWTIGTAKRQLRKLAAFDPEYIEQPLPLEDLAGHAHLRQSCGVPIALDESAYTLQDVHEAGGLLPARKQAAVCEAAGIPVTLHSGAELGLSLSSYVHLATTIPNLSLAIDCQSPNVSADIIAEPFDFSRGWLSVPAGPGLGVQPQPKRIRKFRSDTIPNPYLDPSRPEWFATKPAY